MIKLNQLLKEETFTATNKQSGKTSVFKSKESRDAAIKAGTHAAKDDKTQSTSKVAGGNMFGGDYAKDRGGETATRKWVNFDKDHSIDTDSGMIVPKGKESDTPDPKDIKGIDRIGAGTKPSSKSARKWVNFDKDHSIDTNSGMIVPKGKESDNPNPKDVKGIDSISEPKSDMGVDKVVYNKRTKTVGIVRMADERGETKTDADGNVNTDELEPYNPMKYPHQKDAQVAPSTTKEIDSRGLWKPYSSNEGVIKLSKLMENDPCWKGYKQIGMKDKNGKEVPNCVPESVVKEEKVNEVGVNKMYVKFLAVSKKVRELEDAQKALSQKYFAEKDLNKKETLLTQLKKGTEALKSFRRNLSDIEEKYVMNLDADTEFDV